MPKILMIILILFVWSCNEPSKNTTSRINNDSIRYYPNGTIKSSGILLSDSIPSGKWEYFDENGIKYRSAEYLNINGEPFINQDWFYSETGDTIKGKGSYCKIIFNKDTIDLSEPIIAKIDLIEPLFKNEYSNILVVVPKDYSVNFNSDFSNRNQVVLDTSYNLNLDLENRKRFELKTDFGKTAFVGRYFDSPGKKKFRGIITEYFYRDSIMPDGSKLNYFYNEKYFEKEIYVTDSIKQ